MSGAFNTSSDRRSTKAALALLRQYESRNVTFIEDDGSWPIVWDRAKGVQVWDMEGRRYLDLTGAFGVAAAGHANPAVVRAGRRQMGHLLHAMGDVHPHVWKGRLARELSRLTFERWTTAATQPKRAGRRETPIPLVRGQTIFCNSGFEAVEAALKTARLVTGKRGVLAFEGAYHGLGYGALNATHREHFRAPFRDQLGQFGYFVPFPASPESPGGDMNKALSHVRKLLRTKPIGAVLIEPLQVRGGIKVPPAGWLAALRQLCDAHRVLLVLDEIYTGFGRTGKWFACEHYGVVPDLICLGKALTGGFPLSACVGRAEIMDAAWPSSAGEAIHTSTFLGHPVGCAMALAQIAEIERRQLVFRSAQLGHFLLQRLREIRPKKNRLMCRSRGLGLLAGLELLHSDGSAAGATAFAAVKAMLRHGYILLPEGGDGNVLGFTPPLTITKTQLEKAVGALEEVLSQV